MNHYFYCLTCPWCVAVKTIPVTCYQQVTIQSDVSESSERSERVRVEYSYLMISPEIIRDSPDERLTLYDSCLSPTTTFQGSENLKVSPIYNVGRIRRDEPSLAGLVVVRLYVRDPKLSPMCLNHPPTAYGLGASEEIAQGCRG